MAKENLGPVIDLVFGHEGGFTDDPKDPGNWSTGKVGKGTLVGTKYGITGATLAAWRGHAVTLNNVKDMELDEAKRILKKQYWDPIRGDDLPSGVDYATFDYSVNSGPGQAAKSLQRVVGAGRDGVVGTKTLAKIADMGAWKVVDDLCDERLRFLKSLSTWARYGKGWGKRVESVRASALAMTRGTQIFGLLEPGSSIEVSGVGDGDAKALPTDVRFSATQQGKGILFTAAGSVVTGVGQAVDTLKPVLEPLTGSGGVVDRIFTILTIAGVIAVIAGIVLSAVTQASRIESGAPS